MNNISKVALVFMALIIGLSLMATWYAYGRKHICPSHDDPEWDISPCVCDVDKKEIRCGGHRELDLVKVFNQLNNFTSESEKHFSRFILNNTSVSKLSADTFGSFAFDDIDIKNCPVTKIHRDTFRGTDRVTKHLNIDSLRINGAYVSDLFAALRRFTAAERITLRNNSLGAVPDHAFNYEMMDDSVDNDQGAALLSLLIYNDKIEYLGQWAFVHFPNAVHISLNNNELRYIRNHSFAFDHKRTNTIDLLKIDLSDNWLYSDSFDNFAFDELNRRTFIDLSDNMMEFIPQEVFETFLDAWPQNSIEIDENPLKCENCGNAWLVANKRKYADRIHGALCNDTFRPLFDYTTDEYLAFGCLLPNTSDSDSGSTATVTTSLPEITTSRRREDDY